VEPPETGKRKEQSKFDFSFFFLREQKEKMNIDNINVTRTIASYWTQV